MSTATISATQLKRELQRCAKHPAHWFTRRDRINYSTYARSSRIGQHSKKLHPLLSWQIIDKHTQRSIGYVNAPSHRSAIYQIKKHYPKEQNYYCFCRGTTTPIKI